MTPTELARAIARDTRRSQGLPATVKDPQAVARLAVLLELEADRSTGGPS